MGKAGKMETRLYIGNMSQEMTEEDLHTMFSEAGTVEAVDVVIDPKSGKPRGFAFVTMSSQKEAEKATALFNAKEVYGRTLKVNITLPREAKPGKDATSNKF
jgi:RNA recognition motif-containing protein